MSSTTRKTEGAKPSQQATSVRQQTVSDGSFIEGFSFDRTALVLFGGAFLVGLGLLWYFEVLGVLPVFVAILASAFTLQSVRESKRDREASVAPTLFVGTKREEHGVLNLGSGPAHELALKTADDQPTDWDQVDPELEGAVLRVDDFLGLGTEETPQYLRMEYRSNVGYKKYNVTREVLSDDD